MKITLFTSNQARHNYLINSLDGLCSELFVIQEKKMGSKSSVTSHKLLSKPKRAYFKNVINSEKIVFGKCKISKKIKVLKIKGDINNYKMIKFKGYLNADLYIVYGSSFIKGRLLDFLISKNAIGLHMGISPYYRGTDCNFWAIHDNNTDLVGATIFLLAKGLDNGKIFFHALPKKVKNPFIFSMKAVMAGFKCLIENIKNDNLYKNTPFIPQKKKEIRYTKLSDFTDEVVKDFNKKKIDISLTKIDKKKFINPYILNE